MIIFNYNINMIFLLNKLVIPAILAVTVMVAGVFAFMPVEQASTVHASVLADIVNDISGSSLILTSSTFTTNFTGTSNERFHYVILESDELFTVKEVEIEVNLGNASGGGDLIQLRDVYMMADQYASTKAGIEEAEANDRGFIEVCDPCPETMQRGSDTLTAITWSYNGMMTDEEDANNLPVGPGSKLIFEIRMQEQGDQDLDNTNTATIIFYLSGPDEASDMTVVELENETTNTDGPGD